MFHINTLTHQSADQYNEQKCNFNKNCSHIRRMYQCTVWWAPSLSHTVNTHALTRPFHTLVSDVLDAYMTFWRVSCKHKQFVTLMCGAMHTGPILVRMGLFFFCGNMRHRYQFLVSISLLVTNTCFLFMEQLLKFKKWLKT